MSKTHNLGGNLSFSSIRYTPSRRGLQDAYKCEELRTATIDLQTLRTISRIVRAIKEKIAVTEQSTPGNAPQTCIGGNPSGSEITGPPCCENIGEERENN
jgi:hypothetical protein